MEVKQVCLAASAFDNKGFPRERRPEIAFLGRSNVGKSSLINCLLGRKKLARTSSTPGKTRGLYFYLLNESFYFVDLPGYGYAKVARSLQRRWAPLIEEYLGRRETLCGCVQLLDVRHPPTEDDLLMHRWLAHYRLPTVTVATKADKLSRGALLRQVGLLRRELALAEGDPLLPFSALKGLGKKELWIELAGLLEAFSNRSSL